MEGMLHSKHDIMNITGTSHELFCKMDKNNHPFKINTGLKFFASLRNGNAATLDGIVLHGCNFRFHFHTVEIHTKGTRIC